MLVQEEVVEKPLAAANPAKRVVIEVTPRKQDRPVPGKVEPVVAKPEPKPEPEPETDADETSSDEESVNDESSAGDDVVLEEVQPVSQLDDESSTEKSGSNKLLNKTYPSHF